MMLSIKSVEKQLSVIGPDDRGRILPDDKLKFRFLSSVKMYLLTKPKESFCASELQRMLERKQSILNSFEIWKKNNPQDWESKYFDLKDEKDRKRAMGEIFSYFKETMGMTDINRQIKMLKFILDPKSTVLPNEIANSKQISARAPKQGKTAA